MLEKKLEELKQLGMYGIQLWFGEGVGCDDSDVPLQERRLIIKSVPVGCVGGAAILYKGNVADCLNFDFKTKPTLISNPPKSEEYEDGGYYIWGESAQDILEKPFFGKWK